MNQKIYKFNEFISIFEARKSISDKLFDALAEGIPELIINTWITSPEFGGAYTRPSQSNPNLREIFYRWEGVEKKFPNVFYKRGKIIPDPSLNIPPNDNSFWDNILNPMENMARKSTESILKSIPKNEEKFMEIIENLPIVKAIRSKGIKFTISKEGESVFIIRFPNTSPSIFSTLIVPSKEVLESSILRDYSEYIINIGKKEGVPDESIRKIASILSTKDGFTKPAYRKEYNKIIKKYPTMVLYLIEPPGGKIDDENKELVKGARIIGRLGISPE